MIVTEVGPLPGMQTAAITAKQRHVWMGGIAGPGKSVALAFIALLFKAYRTPAQVLAFRRLAKDLDDPAGLLGTFKEFLGPAGAKFRIAERDFTWSLGRAGKVVTKLAALSKAGDVESFRGSQPAAVLFDELHQFLPDQYTFMASRNRVKKGARYHPMMRATMNPNKARWIRNLVNRYLNADGFVNYKLCGKTSWFVGAPSDSPDTFVSSWSRKKLLELHPKKKPASFTFLGGRRDEQPFLDFEEYDENLSLLPDDQFEALALGNWNCGPPDPAKIFNPPAHTFFTPDDEDFQAALRLGPLQQFAAWDYGRQKHGLCRIWGVVSPGAPPILWILESKVWTQTSAIQAAADAKLCYTRVDLDIDYGEIFEAGDPSGIAGDSGEGWFKTLRIEGLNMIDLRHSSIMGTEEQRHVYWNTHQGYCLRTEMCQGMMERGALRVCDWRHCAALVDALKEWRLAVPEDMRPIDVDRAQLGPEKGKHSHPGDAVSYLAAFFHAMIKAQRNPANELGARKNPRQLSPAAQMRAARRAMSQPI